jgi:transcriptional regulator with XRE-family HTH domain
MAEVTMPGPEVLSKMRKVLGMPQAELAQRTGIERSLLSYWESGQKQLSDEQIDAVARVIHEESWRRSEEKTLPPATDVPVTSAERAHQMRQMRLEWGVTQAELSAATGLPDNLISMWERGYVQLDREELARLSDALTVAISKRSSMLAWYLNANEIERGKVTELRAALSAPVRMTPPVEKPITLHKKERLAALKKKVGVQATQIVELRKIADLSQQMNRNTGEANVLLTHVVGEVEGKIAAMQANVSRMPASPERDQFVGFLNELVEVIEQ